MHRRSDEAQRVRSVSVMPLNLIVGFLPDGLVVLLDVFRKARRPQLVNGSAAIHLVGDSVDRIHHGQGVPVGYIDDLIGEDEGVMAGKAGSLRQERRNVVGIDIGKTHHLDTGMLPFEPLRIRGIQVGGLAGHKDLNAFGNRRRRGQVPQEGQFFLGPRGVVDTVNRKNRPRATPGRKQPSEPQDLAAELVVAAKLVDDGNPRLLPGKLGRVTKLIQQGAP